MTITINGSGTITGASTLATTIASPTLTIPNIDSAQFSTVSGTAPIYPCRAWVNFNGTGTVAIRASGNVSSITDNGVAIIIPAESIEAAMKDIPEGSPYKIVDVADVPTDRTFRNAWEYSPNGSEAA